MAVTPITYIGRLVAKDNGLPALGTMYSVATRYISTTGSINSAIPASYVFNNDSDLVSASMWSYIEDANPAVTIADDEDFTVEFWMLLHKTGIRQTIINGPTSDNLFIYLGTASRLNLSLGATSASHNCSSYTFSVSTWYHVAFVRNGGTITFYVNGDAIETWAMNAALSIPASVRYGQQWSGGTALYQFYGQLAGVCIMRGAKYTAPFAPPMTPAQYEDVTSAPVELFELVGDTVTDRYGHNLAQTDISTSGDATFLGQNTLLFNGTSSVLTTPLYCGKAADFTIDWWCKPNSIDSYNDWDTMFEWRSETTAGRGHYCHIMTMGGFVYSAPGVATSSSGYASAPVSYHSIGGNNWNHYAIVKRNGTCYFYINGVQHAVTYATSNYMWPTLLSVGKCAFTNGYYSGYIARLRICCGARWTQNFAVPNHLADYGTGTAKKWDITNGVPEQIKFSQGTIVECNYSGSAVPITLPRGTYKLECWGASGGYYQSFCGGRGGYSHGILTLREDTKLFLYAGGMGEDYESYKRSTAGNVYAGGFNGGGSAKVVAYSSSSTIPSGGGGGTDIRVGTDSLYARVIITGGGSGGVTNSNGYAGGGDLGVGYSSDFVGKTTAAGTNGSFGVGASASPSATNYKYAGTGAGGGWYGGGTVSTYSDSDTTLPRQAGGGSGYVYTAETYNMYPTGCLLTEQYYLSEAATLDGAESYPEINGVASISTNYGHPGYIRITMIASPLMLYLHTASGWRIVSGVYANNPTSNSWANLSSLNTSELTAALRAAVCSTAPARVQYVWKKYQPATDEHTKFLLNFDELTSTDNSGNQVPLTEHTAAISAVQSKFGGYSGYFNGTDAWIDFDASSVFDANGDWTIDWWEYISSVVAAACIYNQTNGTYNNDRGILLGYQNSPNELVHLTSDASTWDIAAGQNLGTLTTGEWVHRAVVRSGNTYYTFRNGVQQVSWSSTKNILGTATVGTIGRYANGIKYYKGYIDEFRISDISRWTAGFTPPTEAYRPVEFVGYVTSPIESAYPDKDMADDGFYYERV